MHVIGCASDVGFKYILSETCLNFYGTCTAVKPGGEDYRYSFSFNVRSVTFMVLVDNSPSMQPEQNKMADAFEPFAESLADLNIDWELAMSTAEQKQDGRFLVFPNGDDVLSGIPHTYSIKLI